MVLTSRRARSGGRPVSKPVPSPLLAPTIPEFRDFAKSGNYQFAMRFSMSVFLAQAIKTIYYYLSYGVLEVHQPNFHVSVAFLLTNKT